MKRSIPPKTMRDISRSKRKRTGKGQGIRLPLGGGLRVQISTDQQLRSEQGKHLAEPPFRTGLFKKPRNWRFQTKPLFKKIKGPLVDVFNEAEEVLIVIDLGGLQRDDIELSIRPERYSILAKDVRKN